MVVFNGELFKSEFYYDENSFGEVCIMRNYFKVVFVLFFFFWMMCGGEGKFKLKFFLMSLYLLFIRKMVGLLLLLNFVNLYVI